MKIIRREEHYRHTRPWLETEWHFSFGEYYDPDNVRFGPLRVVNNDRIQGGGGFDMHSHEDMEIITWVIEGSIVHEDSTGTRERIGRNGIQKMSAGTGIAHSEYNGSDDEMLHLVQIWIEPSETGIEPSYEDAKFDENHLSGHLEIVASGREPAPVSIVQDATISVGIWDSDGEGKFSVSPERRGYGVLLKGDGILGDSTINAGDAVRITNPTKQSWRAHSHSEWLWIDLL